MMMGEPPCFVVGLPPLIEATDGDIVTLQVRVSGNPDPAVNWYHCGEPVVHVSGKRDLFKHEDGWYEFVVTNTNEDDEGEYECKAENVYGAASTFGDLYYYTHDISDSTKDDSEAGDRTINDEHNGRQSGLLILIDDGSQTDDDSQEHSLRRSLTASEQMLGIIEDLTQDEGSLTLGRDEFGSDPDLVDPADQMLFEGWHHTNTHYYRNHGGSQHQSTVSDSTWDSVRRPGNRRSSGTARCSPADSVRSGPASEPLTSWYPQLSTTNESFGDLSSDNVSSLSTPDPESAFSCVTPFLDANAIASEVTNKTVDAALQGKTGKKTIKFWDIVEEEEDQSRIKDKTDQEAQSSGSADTSANMSSYSKSSVHSSTSSYVGEESSSKTSVRSTRLDSTDLSSSALSSVRRSTAITSSFDADDDLSSSFRRSSRTSALDDDAFGTGTRRSLLSRIDDDADSGIASLRRTSRLGSRDEDIESTLSSARRLTSRLSKDEDADSPLVTRMSSRTSSKDEEDGMTVRRASKMSSTKEEDDKYSLSKTKFSSSMDAEDENSSLSMRTKKSSMAYKDEDTSGSSVVKTSSSAMSYSESFSSETKGGSSSGGKFYEAIIDFEPVRSDKDAIPVKEGQQVEILDDSSKPRRWFVRTLPFGDLPGGVEGWVPSCYLEQVKTKAITSTTVTEVTKEYTDPKELEASTRRAAVVKELVETEEDFSRDMQYVVKNYVRAIDSPDLPIELRSFKEELFGNFKAISEFHNNELIKGVQYYANEPSKLGITFLRLERDFDKHVKYCKNEPRAQEILETTALKQFFEEQTKKLKDDKTLTEHLKLPIQRINDYQLLLRELIKYSSRLNEDTGDLEKALELMKAIPQKASDAQFLNSIEGYKGNLHKFGRMLCHDWFEVTEGSAGVTRERYVFLFKGRMCVTDVKKVQEKDVYMMKNIVKLNDVKVTEVSGEDKSLTIEHPNSSEPGFPLKLKARTSVQKDSWVKELTVTAIPSALEDLGDDEPVVVAEATETVSEQVTVQETTDTTEQTNQPIITEVVETEEVERTEEITVVKQKSPEPKVEILEDFEAYEEMNTQITESIRSGSLTSMEASDLDTAANKPKFRKSLRSVSCQQGETVTLDCEVISQPPAMVSWLKNNKPVKSGGRIEIVNNGNYHSMTIRETQAEDTALFTVVASDESGTVSCSSSLNVKQASGLGVPKPDSRPTTPGGTVLPHAPVFKVMLKDTELLENTSVRFELVVRGQPEPKVTFYKNDKVLEQDDRVRVHFETKEVFELILDHVIQSDSGKYSCKATNTEGEASTDGNISVTSLVNQLLREPETPQITANLSDVEVSEGASAMLEVKVTGFPKPDLAWSHDGEEIVAGGRYKFLYEDNESVTLVIKNVVKADAGAYKVVAKNELGQVESTGKLMVTHPPAFKKQLKDTSVMTDQPLKLEVVVEGKPVPDIKWYKDGQPLSQGKQVKIDHPTEEVFSLTIDKTKPEDAGSYSCVVTNPFGSQTGFSAVTVNAAPSFVRGLKSVEVLEEETVHLTVKVAGNPKPTLKWSKDGVTVKESDRIKIVEEETNTYSLTIEKVTRTDAGKYECEIKNEHGKDSSSGNVGIKSKPSFSKKLTDMEFRDGDIDIVLEVIIEGLPKSNVKWTRNGKEVTETKNVKIVANEETGSYSLKIKEISSSDAGEYTVQATNSVGKSSSSGNVSVNAGAKILEPLKDVNGTIGQDAAFTIKFKGNPKPNVKWTKAGASLTIDGKHVTVKEEAADQLTLVIHGVTQDDKSEYGVEVSNLFGKDTSSAKLKIEETSETPRFTKSLSDKKVKVGEDVQFSVEVEGKPQPNIRWLYNEKEVKADSSHVIKSDVSTGKHSLKVSSLKETCGGKYTCEAVNDAGRADTSSNVTIQSPPKFVKGLEDQSANEGQNVTFKVKVAGSPKPKVTWMSADAEIKIDGTRIKAKEEASDEFTLIINQVAAGDAGKYSCKITNEYGEEISSCKLGVDSKPVFEKKLEDQEIWTGEETIFEVKVKGSPEPEITWFKEEKTVTETERITITSDGSTHRLVIKRTIIEDSATYKCTATNKAGKVSSEALLSVQNADDSEAPTFIRKMVDTVVITGDAARFEVKVTGKPAPSVTWYKNNEEVVADSRTIVGSDASDHLFTLTLKDLTLKDSSAYSCTAVNDKGEAKEKATLTVKDPVAPELDGMKDAKVQIGSAAKFEVTATGLPSPTISWSKDGTSVKASGNVIIVKDEEKKTYSITIKNAKEEDIGSYTCTASNSAGKCEKTAKLSVKESSPVIQRGLKPQVSLDEGGHLILEAKVDGQPMPEIQWLKDGKPLKPDSHTKISTTPDGTARLEIDNVSPKDAGKYEMVAKNPQGEVKSPSDVTVKPSGGDKTKPKFVKPLEAADLIEGTPTRLEVKAVGNPTPQVAWLKDGEPVKEGSRLRVNTEPDGTSALILDSPTPEDAGKYTCIATNDAGDATTAAPVAISRPPSKKPEFSDGLKPTKFTEGKPGRLEAKISGEPKPDIKWLKDGKELSPNNHVTLLEEPDGTIALLLDNVKPEDAGKYAVVVSNPGGEAKSEAPVTVIPAKVEEKPVKKEEKPAEVEKKPKVDKPRFDQPLLPVLLNEGEPGKMEAKLSPGVKNPTVMWMKDNKPIVPGDHFKPETLPDGTLILNIDNVTPEDKGKYAVVVTNEGGEGKSEAKATTVPKVMGPPGKKPEFEKGLSPKKDLTEGEALKLEAKVVGEPKPEIKWLKDGEEVTPSNRVYTHEEPDGNVKLTIDHALPEDSGKYAVVAMNDEGKTRSPCMVEVKPVQKKKPEVEIGLEKTALTAGQPGKLTAKLTGHPKPAIKWLKDGKEIVPDSRVKIREEPDGSSTLFIDSVVPEDAGKYTVVAANENGETRSSAPVTVNQPPIFTKPLQSADAVEGYPSKLEALLSGEPMPEIKWMKDGKVFKPDGIHVKAFQTPEGNVGLVFDRCIPQDSANYCCIANNPFGEASSDADLGVTPAASGEPASAPTTLTPLSDVEVKEGEPIKLEVSVSGSPFPSIQWLLDGQPIFPSDNIHQTFDGKKATLEIRKSNPQHAGKFEVKATNPTGTTSSQGQVSVVERSPPKFIQRLVDLEAPSSEPLKLQCRVKGFPEPEIEWSFNGSPIFPGLKYNMTKEGDHVILTLPHPRAKDSGHYECKAKNSVGQDSCRAQAKISDKGEKGQPPMFLKKLGDCESTEGGTAKCTACIVGAPAPDIKWFRNGEQLEFTPRHKFELEPNGLLRLFIRDLQPEDFGEYRLSISNPYGSDTCTGKLIRESDKMSTKPIGDQYAGFDKFKKSGAPVPLPDKPCIKRMSDDNLTLAWKPSVPIYPRLPVTYQVEHMRHPDGQWSPYKSGIRDSTCDVLGLEPGQDYRYRVRVQNEHGMSDPSPYVTAHRSKLRPPSPGEYKPKDYEIEHQPLDKNAAAPRFLRKEEDTMYGIRGRPVSIEFWVYGYPEPSCTWYFNNTKLETGGKYDFLQDRNGQVIVFITRMTEDDVGTFSCHAVNEHGEAKQKINLLLAEPPVFTHRLEETTIMIRRSGRLECRVIGKPYPKVKWFKDWQPLHESSRIKILYEEPDKHTLFLSGSILKDSGLYSCSATNLADTASSSAMVTIEENENEYDILTYSRPRTVKPRNKPFEDLYDLGEELGRGTQGVTYHVVERSSGKSYARKMMRGTDSKVKDFMVSEMDIMNQLNHPRLLRLWDSFETHFTSSLITDLCGGGELLDHILKKGSLTESEVAAYVKQILEGLEHMHSKNIAHLGLTVGDILLARLHGDNIKIGDFGLAARLHPGRNYIQLYGHPEFVAPELVKKAPSSLAADMWSVGVVTYLLLSGISPFLGENDRETLTRVQEGKINFFHDAFAEVSDDARDFLSKLLVFDPTGRLDVKAALAHPWLKLSEIPDKCDNLNNIDRLSDYYKKWKSWYANASCRNYYRRRTMESCFTHPSRMIYPPGEDYTPNESPERELNRSKPKAAAFDDTYKQKINREPIDIRSESLYQNGPDTYLLQLRDTDFPRRVRQYLRVGASRSPSLASNLKDSHWGNTHVAVRERRKFLDVMDEEIDDEKKGLSTRTIPLRLSHEIGTLGYAHEQIENLKQEAWQGKGSREAIIGGIPFFRERIVDLVVRDGQDGFFSCFAMGTPTPSYSWFRNDGILIMSSRLKVKQTSSGRCELHLTPGKAYDAGVYKCVARNSHGVSVCRARLKMGDVPGKPEAPEISQCSGTEIYVVWAAPRFSGNAHILCYNFEYKQKDDETWTKIADNIEHEYYIVKDLTPSKLYQFRVTAMNTFGWGAPSNPSETTSTGDKGDGQKIRISKARKFRQEATERAKECPFTEDEEEEEFTYTQEENPVALKEGNEYGELYNFVTQITKGRFSMVVKTWLKNGSETLVSKLILTDNENDTAVNREYEIMKSLCHKHIVRLVTASKHHALTVLVMERLSGVDILTYLASKHQYNEETVAKVITQVLEALDYLHHRDICYLELQPDNVVLVTQNKLQIKLVDFGSAHFVPKTGIKVDFKGTTEYMAPEVLKKEEVSSASDIWGVAVLTYILLSGVSPFVGENETETADNVSYVRYRFENLHKEVTQEATRFLMHIFKRTPSKRPTVEECLEHKWLLPSEFLLKKREHAVFLAHKLHEFSEQFHSQKQGATPPRLLNMFGMSFTRSISLENDTYEEI